MESVQKEKELGLELASIQKELGLTQRGQESVQKELGLTQKELGLTQKESVQKGGGLLLAPPS